MTKEMMILELTEVARQFNEIADNLEDLPEDTVRKVLGAAISGLQESYFILESGMNTEE